MKEQSQPEEDLSAEKRLQTKMDLLRENVNQQGAEALYQPAADSEYARKQGRDVMGISMEPERNCSSWYDFCREKEVTSGQQEGQAKRKEECEGHRMGEDVKAAPTQRASKYCGANGNIKRGKRKERMYSSSSSRGDRKEWGYSSEGDKWDTRHQNHGQGGDVKVGEHVQERFRNKEG